MLLKMLVANGTDDVEDAALSSKRSDSGVRNGSNLTFWPPPAPPPASRLPPPPQVHPETATAPSVSVFPKESQRRHMQTSELGKQMQTEHPGPAVKRANSKC